MAVPSRVRVVIAWGMQALLALAFISIGIGKFTDPSWVRSFERWGYPPGFHLVVGVIEAGCGVLLLVPRLASYAAFVLGGVMISAAVTHATAGQPWTRPLPHLTLLMILAWLRWRERGKRHVKLDVRSQKLETPS